MPLATFSLNDWWLESHLWCPSSRISLHMLNFYSLSLLQISNHNFPLSHWQILTISNPSHGSLLYIHSISIKCIVWSLLVIWNKAVDRIMFWCLFVYLLLFIHVLLWLLFLEFIELSQQPLWLGGKAVIAISSDYSGFLLGFWNWKGSGQTSLFFCTPLDLQNKIQHDREEVMLIWNQLEVTHSCMWNLSNNILHPQDRQIGPKWYFWGHLEFWKKHQLCNGHALAQITVSNIVTFSLGKKFSLSLLICTTQIEMLTFQGCCEDKKQSKKNLWLKVHTS